MIRFSKLLIKTPLNKIQYVTIIPPKFQIPKKMIIAILNITSIETTCIEIIKEIMILDIIFSKIVVKESSEYLKNPHQINTEFWLKRNLCNKGLLLRSSKAR